MKSIKKYIEEIQAQNGRLWIEEIFQRAKMFDRDITSLLLQIDNDTVDYSEEDEEEDEE